MIGTTILFGDGILDVHVANGVARLTIGAAASQAEQKPVPTGTLVIPVMQLPAFARILGEVTRQVEQRAKEAAAQAKPAPAATEVDQVAGAFRFNG